MCALSCNGSVGIGLPALLDLCGHPPDNKEKNFRRGFLERWAGEARSEGREERSDDRILLHRPN